MAIDFPIKENQHEVFKKETVQQSEFIKQFYPEVLKR